MKKFSIAFAAYSLFTFSAQAAKTLAPHVHGSVQFALAMEDDRNGTLTMNSPGDSIYGFEYVPKTAKDKKIHADKDAILEKKADLLIRFPADRKCKIANTKIVAVKDTGEDDDKDNHDIHGQHYDVSAEFSVTCEASVNASAVTVGVFDFFPRIKDASFQFLSNHGQIEKKVSNSKTTIKLP